jgi:hypothetical protein
VRAAAAAKFAEEDPLLLQYGYISGYPAFRGALAGFLAAQYAQPVDAEHLFVTNGVSGALALYCSLFCTRGDVVLWALANTATLNAAFGSQVAAQSPVVVAGWSLGAATVVQHVGADFGFGAYADLRVRGAVLFANPAVGAYGGVITTAGLAQVDKPTLAILGTDDLGQPGSFPPGTLPATSPATRTTSMPSRPGGSRASGVAMTTTRAPSCRRARSSAMESASTTWKTSYSRSVGSCSRALASEMVAYSMSRRSTTTRGSTRPNARSIMRAR